MIYKKFICDIFLIKLMQRPYISKIIQKMNLEHFEIGKTDKLYIFGRNPEFSLAEIVARFHVLDVPFKIKALNNVGVVIEAANHISIDNCGSVLKRCKPIMALSTSPNDKDLKKNLTDHIANEFFEEKGYWTISFYAKKYRPEEEQLLQSIQSITKQALKKSGIRKAFFFKGESNFIVEPRKLRRKKVIRDGLEMVIWQNRELNLLWQTDEVIDIDGIAKRDSDRPQKRPLLLLGLALARTMINLVSIETNHHDRPIFDAFCGMGSIVGEAYLLGLNALGSDIDPSCMTRSQENLTWLSNQKQNFKKWGPFSKENIFTMDATTPNSEKVVNYSGSIVSEPNLLTPLRTYPSDMEADALLRTFEQNYRGYLRGIQKILPDDGVCVFIFPQFHTSTHQRVGLDISKLLEDFGFAICEFPLGSEKYPAYFVHSWKDPIIERQIIVFKKK